MGTQGENCKESQKMTGGITPERIESFFSEELDAWREARMRYEALSSVLSKDIIVGGRLFRAQCNPARALSSSAKTDAASLAARKCFLCRENRPAEQGFLELLPGYELLLNPFPIFPRHFTIPATEHAPQRISRRFADMARFALMMPGYTIFYNGPRCGASAPDHMHFQAGNTGFLNLPPLGGDAVEVPVGRGGMIYADANAVIPFFRIIVTDVESAEDAFGRLYDALRVSDEEPMMNILCRASDGQIIADIIPRRAHRPGFYGLGEGCVLLSPASVDLGGVFIFPRSADFEKADSAMLSQAIGEVCVPPSCIKSIADRL